MKTTAEITQTLKVQLKREPTKDEIEKERVRLMKLWYADMAISAASFQSEGEDS